MFLDSIPGLDKVFLSEPPEGSVILVVGSAGTLKSAFTYNLISSYLMRKPKILDQGIFVTLEETRDSLLKNIRTMGIQSSERIQISDVASFMRDIEYWSDYVTTERDYIELILEKASRPLNIYKRYSLDGDSLGGLGEGSGSEDEKDMVSTVMRPSIFVLDSLNALNSIVYRSIKNVRKEMNSFMFKLREKGITSFIVMEVGNAREHQPEHFLVDGIIELGIMETERNRYKRYLRVQKMRATKHSIEPFLIEVTEKGISIVEELI